MKTEMIKKTIAAALCSILCGSAFGQNIDQTVNITNEFKAEAENVQKQDIPLAVPDSLTNFDYHFNYTVFDTPYRGSYEFSPYAVSLSPSSSEAEDVKFLLRAGAGYSFHPQLQAVWSPLREGSVRLDVYQDFHGYAGRYRSVSDKVDNHALYTIKGAGYSGYDFSEKFGTGLRLLFKKAEIRAGIEYDGIFNDDSSVKSICNSLTFNAGVHSIVPLAKGFRYDVGLHFRTFTDALSSVAYLEGTRKVSENEFGIDGVVGPFLTGPVKLAVDFDFTGFSYRASSAFDGAPFCWNVTPNTDVTLGPVRFRLGVRMSGADKFYLRPDVRLAVNLLNNTLELNAGFTGGAQAGSYAALKNDNHRFNPAWSAGVRHDVENFNVYLGARGSAIGHIQYSVRAGFADVATKPFWGIVENPSGIISPRLVFSACTMLYADLNLDWKSEHVDAGAALKFRKMNSVAEYGAVDLSPVSCSLHALYKHNGRIFAGLTLDAASSRAVRIPSADLAVQGYCDLGIYGEYRFTRNVAFWLRGGNLFNEAVQRIPFIVEQGINFTAGIVLKLQ